MQKEYYGVPQNPELDDAKRLYEWVLGDRPDDGKTLSLQDGPKVLIRGAAPR
jgi:nuclear transport factor 2 (NTF2) superfamily protein